MKKRYLVAGTATGAIGGLIAWKFLTRKGEVNWKDFAENVHHAENSHFVEVDGATVHYQRFGDISNPTLILIHGYTASTYIWKTAAPMLADNGFHVIAVDLLGFGYSDKPAWFDYTITSQARMIERLMDRLGIGRATIIGSSYGGAVAATVTLDYAERVEKLVLVSAVTNDEPKEYFLLKLAVIPGLGELLTPFISDSKAFLKIRMQGTLAPANHHLITPERIEAVHRPLNAADGHNSLLQTARNWDACRIEADASLINQPTLIIWGEQDTVIPIHNGEKLHQEILNSRFVVIRNCGHVPHEEKPEQFVELVTEFCRDRKGRVQIDET